MRLCSGCQTKVEDNVRFCDECKPRTQQSDGIKRHTHGEYDEKLDNLRKGTRWQSTRRSVISKQPICERCHIAPSEIVDHIVPAAVAIFQARESGRWPHDPYAGYYLVSNLQGLCRPCHGLKTVEDKAHVGPWRDVVAVHDAAPKKVWTF